MPSGPSHEGKPENIHCGFVGSSDICPSERLFGFFEEDYKTLDLTQQNHESAEALRLLENLYHEHGQDFSEKDVPHFLPAILEFLSTVSYNEALSWIKQAEPALRAIDRKLLDVSSPWLAVTDSLLSLSKRVAA